jgi:hypothetical protein
MPAEIINIFAIDPSLLDCGWAKVENLIRDENGVWHDDDAKWTYGNWKIQGHQFTFKLQEIVDWCMLNIGCDETWWMVGEWPAYYGTRSGQISAMQGNTINLGAIVAFIAGYFHIHPANLHLLTATQWKGTVPKEITKMRFFKILGVGPAYKVNHNAVDAIMLLHEFCRRRKISFRMINICDPSRDGES